MEVGVARAEGGPGADDVEDVSEPWPLLPGSQQPEADDEEVAGEGPLAPGDGPLLGGEPVADRRNSVRGGPSDLARRCGPGRGRRGVPRPGVAVPPPPRRCAPGVGIPPRWCPAPLAVVHPVKGSGPTARLLWAAGRCRLELERLSFTEFADDLGDGLLAGRNGQRPAAPVVTPQPGDPPGGHRR